MKVKKFSPKFIRYLFLYDTKYILCQDSIVGLALNGPGIESRWGARFSTPVQTGSGPTQPSVQRVSGRFLGRNAAEEWR